ncbi:M23 family metallopeptidase [Tessaracoccus sp. OH4464_COT-324]|uniref:M23 family metallopeptidase n=1 Tax=Tessaracoccus sp. OH4464_COT-324 TaxID=2491059 RepID=UPI000F63B063|nr:M23 family metallopeptidase [Tessaracoccus sp. OH4464_COT-324]RRD46648.1 M23 family metallopeptidase [Tessaracoccus sp. OH4464_COT-324]
MTDDAQLEPIAEAAPTHAKRARTTFRVSKRSVAAGLAGLLAAGSLFSYAITARYTPDVDPGLSANVAIPAEAERAAAAGFVDRSSDVSRNAIREGVSAVAADANARQREAEIELAADAALEAEAEGTAEERLRLLEADLERVAQQADELKKEAAEAAELMKLAKQASKDGKDGKNGKDSKTDAKAKPGSKSLSSEEVQALNTKGGSMPIKENFRVGAHFGQRGKWHRYHTGQDFPAPSGTPIYAVASGVVLSPTRAYWAGTNVVIQHSSGATLYAHMSRSVVSPGTTVKPGQLIGYVGNTGRSYGSHLHFEYYKNGTTPGDVYQASDPMAFLRSLGVR